jgi:predicted RNA-binding Zn ribbon-like protein
VHWRWPAAPAVAVPGATPPMLDRPIWPVAKQAADLLTAPRELARVGLCAGDGCGWLFFDRTGRRRWCSMRSCGNRAKAASYYQRHKGAPHTSTN